MAQFKALERKDVNDPGDLVTVRLLVDGMYSDKAAGDTIDLPAATARRLVEGKVASTHDEEAADPLEVRIDNHLSQFDAERAVNPEVSGQAGLAAMDRVAAPNRGLGANEAINGRMFRDSQDLAEQRAARGVFEEAQDKINKTVEKQQETVKERKELAKQSGVSVPADERSSSDPNYTDQPSNSGGQSESSDSGDSYDDMNRGQLEEQARSRGIAGAGGMNKSQLAQALRDNDQGNS